MKCVRLLQTGDIYRVSDVMARVTVEMGQAVYTNKSSWKQTGRKYTHNLKGVNSEAKRESESAGAQ